MLRLYESQRYTTNGHKFEKQNYHRDTEDTDIPKPRSTSTNFSVFSVTLW